MSDMRWIQYGLLAWVVMNFGLLVQLEVVRAEEVVVEIDSSIQAESSTVIQSTNRLELRQEKVEQRQQVIQEQKESRVERVSERQQLRCERVQMRVTDRLEQYEANKEKWSQRYNKILDRVTGIQKRLESQGCDTTEIEKDIVAFDSLISDFAANFRLFVEDFGNARASACEDEGWRFGGNIQDARAQLEEVRKKASELRSFFQNTLQPNVREAIAVCRQGGSGE